MRLVSLLVLTSLALFPAPFTSAETGHAVRSETAGPAWLRRQADEHRRHGGSARLSDHRRSRTDHEGCVAAPPCSAFEWAVDFTSDPLAGGDLVIDGPGDPAQISWDAEAEALRVQLDSGEPSVRASWALPGTLDGNDDFRFGVVMTLEELIASPADFFQVAVALLNGTTTGLNRTGTAPIFGDADVFDMVEITYFPNVTAFGGPSLSPSIFGSELPGSDAFGNFAGVFGSASDLGDNQPPLIDALPTCVPLELVVEHSAGSGLLLTSVRRLDGPRSRVLFTGLVPLDLSGLHAADTFELDRAAVTSYFDAADFDPSTVSLQGEILIHELFVEARGEAPCTVADFDGLAAGTLVTDQFAGLLVSGTRPVRVFDTGLPTCGDDDLATPGAGPGNELSRGGVLVLSEDGPCQPDDAEAGGVLVFELETLSRVGWIGLLDIDEAGGSVRALRGDQVVAELPIPALGDGSWQAVALDACGVDRVEVELAGSGAVTDLACD
ncbi:MAG: hypothetical protein AAF533_08205 [Acidobacteriota bacterium]